MLSPRLFVGEASMVGSVPDSRNAFGRPATGVLRREPNSIVNIGGNMILAILFATVVAGSLEGQNSP